MKPNIYHQKENTSQFTFSTQVYSAENPYESSLHFHKNYEIITVSEGFCTVIHKKTRYSLKQGEAIFIEPFITHGIELGEGAVIRSTTTHQNLIYTISNFIEPYHPESPIFIPNQSVLDYYNTELESCFGKRPFQTDLLSPTQMIAVKGSLYAIGSEFMRQATFLLTEKTPYSLIQDMIEYISKNYLQNITMREMANALGYSYHYLSRTFNSALDMSFNAMLNHYRMEHAVALLHDTRMPIGEIMFKSGFKNQHSFNESCLKFYGKTPREIRKRSQLIIPKIKTDQ